MTGVTEPIFSEFTTPPALPGVYRMFDAEGRCLYVGETNRCSRRLTEHKKSKKWFPEAVKFDFTEVEDPENRLVIETIQIFNLRPRHNRTIKIGLDKCGNLYPLNFVRTKRAY